MEYNQTQAIELTSTSITDFGDEDKEKEKAFIEILPNKHVKTAVYPLFSGDNTIGRDNSCNVCIKSQTLSKQHAVIQINRGEYVIHDVGSLNKTKKNNSVLSPKIRYNLSNNDKILLADIECRFTISNPDKSLDSDSDTGSDSSFFIKNDSTQEKLQTKNSDDPEIEESLLNIPISKNFQDSEFPQGVEKKSPNDESSSDCQTQLQTIDVGLPSVSMDNLIDLSNISVIGETPAPNREKKDLDSVVADKPCDLILESSQSDGDSVISDSSQKKKTNNEEEDIENIDAENEFSSSDKFIEDDSSEKKVAAENETEEDSHDKEEVEDISEKADKLENKTENDDDEFREQVLTLLRSPLESVSKENDDEKAPIDTIDDESNDLENVKKFLENSEQTTPSEKKKEDKKKKNDEKTIKSPDNLYRLNLRTRKSNTQKEGTSRLSRRKETSLDSKNESCESITESEFVEKESEVQEVETGKNGKEESEEISHENSSNLVHEEESLEKNDDNEIIEDDAIVNSKIKHRNVLESDSEDDNDDEYQLIKVNKEMINDSKSLQKDTEEEKESVECKEGEKESIECKDEEKESIECKDEEKESMECKDEEKESMECKDEEKESMECKENGKNVFDADNADADAGVGVEDTASNSKVCPDGNDKLETSSGDVVRNDEVENEEANGVDDIPLPSKNEPDLQKLEEAAFIETRLRRVVIKVEDCLASPANLLLLKGTTKSTLSPQKRKAKLNAEKSSSPASKKRRSVKSEEDSGAPSPPKRRNTGAVAKSNALTKKNMKSTPSSRSRKKSPTKPITPKKKVGGSLKSTPMKSKTKSQKSPVRKLSSSAKKSVNTSNSTSRRQKSVSPKKGKVSTKVSNPKSVTPTSAKKRSTMTSTGSRSLRSRTVSDVDELVVSKSPESASRRRRQTPLAARRSVENDDSVSDSQLNSTPAKKANVKAKAQSAVQKKTPISKRTVKSPKRLIDESVETKVSSTDEVASKRIKRDLTTTTPPSSRKSTRNSKAVAVNKIIFTGITNKKAEKIIDSLGGSIVQSIDECTHLITDKVRRTVKLLCVLSKGMPIVNVNWILKSGQAGKFLDANQFLVKDSSAEKQFKFSLSQSLQRAIKQPLFKGYKIHVTNNVKPEPQEMKQIIESAGGQYLDALPSRKAPSSQVVVVSCPEDLSSCSRAVKQKIPVVDSEFILTGVMRQEIDLAEHLLE